MRDKYNHPGSLKCYVHNALWNKHSIEFLLSIEGSVDGQLHRSLCKEIIFEEIKNEDLSYQRIEPSFELDMEDAQQLMDELWRCGLRPTEGSGSAGSLRATQNHLEDLRKLVFKDKYQKL